MDEKILKCPRCNKEMRKISQESVVIDVCDHCQGMWLDKGEIKKLTRMKK